MILCNSAGSSRVSESQPLAEASTFRLPDILSQQPPAPVLGLQSPFLGPLLTLRLVVAAGWVLGFPRLF